MGVNVRKEFQRGPFAVMRCELTEVDAVQTMKQAKGEEFAEKFGKMLSLFDEMEMGDQIFAKVFAKLQDKMAEVMPQKLEEQGKLKVAVTCKTAEEQAPYFFEFLRDMDDGASMPTPR